MLQDLFHLFYFISATGLILYGVSGIILAVLHIVTAHRTRRRNATSAIKASQVSEKDLPMVCVQLPLYNEAAVVDRLMNAVASLDYPRKNLQIQILDDSTDETSSLVDRSAGELKQQGFRIDVVRRSSRQGYKGGALALGTKLTDAPFLAVFDADFVPSPDFLRRTIPLFLEDRRLALVQTRWEHLNPTANLLTRAQAVSIDGHFIVQQQARAETGLFMNFNGSGGVWRRRAIDEVGGWHGDTLTEDLDLSYRVYLAGWKSRCMPELAVPGELPETITAYRSQQFRWAKGTMQTAIKLLPLIMASPLPWWKKAVASVHLTQYLAHFFMLLHSLAVFPILLWCRDTPPQPWFNLFASASMSLLAAPMLTSTISMWTLHRRMPSRWMDPLAQFMTGCGLAWTCTRAVWEAISRHSSPFERTPKSGGQPLREAPAKRSLDFLVELGLAGYCCAAFLIFLQEGGWFIGPFLVVYISGFSYFGLRGWAESRSSSQPRAAPVVRMKRLPDPE